MPEKRPLQWAVQLKKSLAASPIAAGVENWAYICGSGDEDYFALSVTTGQEITVDLYGLVDSLPDDFDLELYDPGRGLVAISNNGDTIPERIVHTAGQSGTWYVRVYGFSANRPAEWSR